MGESGRFLHLRREASEDINRKRTAEADAWEAPSLHESVGELVMQKNCRSSKFYRNKIERGRAISRSKDCAFHMRLGGWH